MENENKNIDLNFTRDDTVTMASEPNDTMKADFQTLEKVVAIVVPVFFTYVFCSCRVFHQSMNLILHTVGFM